MCLIIIGGLDVDDNIPGKPARWCVHYRGLGRLDKDVRKCAVGVAYDKWFGLKFAQRPCFLTADGKSKPGAAVCDRIRRPTSEEIEAYENWVEQSWGRQLTVFDGIANWRKANKGEDVYEVIECPACKGRLHLRHYGVNNHVHGACETSGCVNWME